jgi:hypothetical protein
MIRRKVKILSIIIVCIFAFPLFGFGNVLGISQKDIETNMKFQKIESLHQGSALFCILVIESINETGFPDEDYIGVLSDINATLKGKNKLIVTPIPWVIFGTVFETNQTIYVTMEFFAGVIDPSVNFTRITGFAKNIVWEW